MAGVYGFKINDQIKVTYCEWDSQPSVLGYHVFKFVARTGLSNLKSIADRIKLVYADDKPTRESIKRYRLYANPTVLTENIATWTCLLSETQGDLNPYCDDLVHMVDSSDFFLISHLANGHM